LLVRVVSPSDRPSVYYGQAFRSRTQMLGRKKVY